MILRTTSRSFLGCLTLALVLSGRVEHARALDPRLDMSQYAHRAWRNREGFAQTNAYLFAQTPDGYLWLGSGLGLTRFDGVQNKPWQPPAGASLPDIRIGALLVSRDGTLWIGTLGGLASWDGHKFLTYPSFTAHIVGGLAQDQDGTVWAAGAVKSTGFLCAIRGATTQCFGEDGSLGAILGPLHVGGDGSLWVGTINGLWRWTTPGGGTPKLYSLPDPEDANRGSAMYYPGKTVSETAQGAILTLSPQGIRQIVNGEVQPYPDQSLLPIVGPHRLFNDRDGALWIGTYDAGLLHLHQGHVDAFGRAEGLTGTKVHRVFEDHEGNIWVATPEGIDRFSALSAVTYSSRHGLTGSSTSVLAVKDGSIWINTLSGLYRWREGRMFVYRGQRQQAPLRPRPGSSSNTSAEEVILSGLPPPGAASLFEDRRGRIWLGSKSEFGYLESERFTAVHGIPDGYIDSITEDDSGDVWIAKRDIGLLRVSSDLESRRVPSTGPLGIGHWWRVAGDPVHGGVWIGSFSGGVVHFVNDRIQQNYSSAEGLGKGAVNDLRVAPDGSVWAATDGGASRIKDGHISTLDRQNGLPCDQVNATLEQGDGSTWIYTACGLVRITRSDINAWAATAEHGDARRVIGATVLDEYDGVHAYVSLFTTSTPKLSRAPDGRLWFTTRDGVAVVDPRHLQINTLPPPVHVEQLIADRKYYDMSSRISLPPLPRDLEIDYTALSLTAPERIRFRYKLEGRDRDWQDVGNRRQAFYTDLEPGDYRFRVIASNNSGIWNEQGATLSFAVAPAFWQTPSFIILCVTAAVLLLWAVFRLRMRQVAHAAALARENEARQHGMRMELAHANRLATMGQLTASIAHEVNQPLTATVNNANAALRWLKAQPPNLDEIREALEEIVQVSRRGSEIVTHIRGMVKKSLAEQDDVRLNEEIMAVLALTHGELTTHQVVTVTDLAPDLPVIKGNRVQLQQVLLNLIVNAIEAMSTVDHGPRELVVSSKPQGDGGLLISVCDTGPGLAPEDTERIFQPFHTTKHAGLGMGLAICVSIIEAHGGRLSATANAPRGAVFQFTLNRQPPS